MVPGRLAGASCDWAPRHLVNAQTLTGPSGRQEHPFRGYRNLPLVYTSNSTLLSASSGWDEGRMCVPGVIRVV